MTPIRFEKHSKSWPWVSIDRWIIGHQGVLLFTLSALCSLALTPIFLGWIHPARMSYSLRIFWAALEILGPIGLVLIYFGMWLYWVRLDGSRVWTKRAWFVILLVGPWYGSCLYCFFVYLPQVLAREKKVEG